MTPIVGRAAAALVILFIAGCGTASEPSPQIITMSTPSPAVTPTPFPTAIPTPTPTPAPTDEELAAICAGEPLVQAAAYRGEIHPLVLAYEQSDPGTWSIDTYHENPYGSGTLDQWTGPIQLAVCVSTKTVKAASCGTYKVGDTTGSVTARQWVYTVRVIIAKTGKVLQTKTFNGPKPSCPFTFMITKGDPPPWNYYGDGVSDATIAEYAKAVSTQAVK